MSNKLVFAWFVKLLAARRFVISEWSAGHGSAFCCQTSQAPKLFTTIILAGHPQNRLHTCLPNIFNSRHRWILAGIILLAGGIVFEEKHRAATLNGHPIIPPELAYAVPYDGMDFFTTNKNFGDNVNLWFNPAREIHGDDLTYASVVFQSELGEEAAYDQMENRAANQTIHLPTLDVADKTVNYSLFTIGHFTATLNLTPVLPTPQAIIPTDVKPGLGGSFDF